MSKANYRREMIAKIQIEFPKLRRDLDGDELRRARLEFCRDACGLKETPVSITALNDAQLGLVLDRMKEVGGQKAEVRDRPSLTSCTVRPLKPKTREAIEQMGLQAIEASESGVSCGVAEPGQIIHLAGNAQAWACARVMDYLEWPDQKRQEYIGKRFRRTSEKMLRPDQARSLLIQLLTIAAHAELKLRHGKDQKFSREQITTEIPMIKRRLGIDR